VGPPPAQPAATSRAQASTSISATALGPRRTPAPAHSPTPAALAKAPTTQPGTPAGSRSATGDPGGLQTSVTALQRGADDGVSSVPSTLLGLSTAVGVGVVALLARWRWKRRARRDSD
jgi:hypothetical protein